MGKGLYEICGPFGALVHDVVVEEDGKDPYDIGRELAESARMSLPLTVRQRSTRRRVQRVQALFGPMKMFLITVQQDDGKVHPFTAERLRDAG